MYSNTNNFETKIGDATTLRWIAGPPNMRVRLSNYYSFGWLGDVLLAMREKVGQYTS
jgi:hypothetical protein